MSRNVFRVKTKFDDDRQRVVQRVRGTAVEEFKIEHNTAHIDGRDVRILRLEGCLDTQTFPTFEEELTRLVKDGYYNLLLDLEKMTYINAASVGLIMAMLRQVRQHGGNLVIHRANTKISHIFNALGLRYIQEPDTRG